MSEDSGRCGTEMVTANSRPAEQLRIALEELRAMSVPNEYQNREDVCRLAAKALLAIEAVPPERCRVCDGVRAHRQRCNLAELEAVEAERDVGQMALGEVKRLRAVLRGTHEQYCVPFPDDYPARRPHAPECLLDEATP